MPEGRPRSGPSLVDLPRPADGYWAIRQGGVIRADHLQRWHRHWCEPYRFMLAIPWPGFLLAIDASYLLGNLDFARFSRSRARLPHPYLSVGPRAAHQPHGRPHQGITRPR